MTVPTETRHATTVAVENRAVLILGRSGAGKSALGLELLSRGAGLISDDRTVLTRVDGHIMASAPTAIAGLIEARGVGLLHAPVVGPAPVKLVVDLDQTENARLPKARFTSLLGRQIRCLARVDASHFPAAILLCLLHGISEPS